MLVIVVVIYLQKLMFGSSHYLSSDEKLSIIFCSCVSFIVNFDCDNCLLMTIFMIKQAVFSFQDKKYLILVVKSMEGEWNYL